MLNAGPMSRGLFSRAMPMVLGVKPQLARRIAPNHAKKILSRPSSSSLSPSFSRFPLLDGIRPALEVGRHRTRICHPIPFASFPQGGRSITSSSTSTSTSAAPWGTSTEERQEEKPPQSEFEPTFDQKKSDSTLSQYEAAAQAEVKANEEELSTKQRIKLGLISNAGMIVGGLIVAYAVSKVLIYTSSTFMHVNFKTVGYVGFFVGFGSAVVTGYLFNLVHRITYIRPERVFKKAFNVVSSNPEFRKMMKVSALHPLRSGTVRAYQLRNGGIGLNPKTGMLRLERPQVQMIFQVYSPTEQAAIVAEAEKNARGINLDFVSADIITQPDSPTYILVGDESKMHVRGELRDFVTLKRKYVKSLSDSN